MIARLASSRLVPGASRSFQTSAISRSGHGKYTTEDAVPFSFKNRGTFALKVVTYFGFGLSLPVIASAYQLSKK
ncbi:hypothetical protein CYLTODRAFT_416699 [Cylindrobasidium torrendii FP15055 ss-10]|uniref:Cytochrome c oxidase subunit 8, mitochondrial n=1 Tax=Cylindrobasidium torrendii FP15055 ss-10 TaxID=1314674 RepID=A0A0D7BTB6_9AGAR|nr:hypothetical protein CYLTODRAFT_416699 [Cylindrobasidium torrendii FP15055 ss-10]